MYTYLNMHRQVGIVLNLLESKVRKSDFSLYPFNVVIHLKSIGTSISVKQQDEKHGHPILSGDEMVFT